MFFAPSGLNALWDKDDELLLAGPWCQPWAKRGEWEALRWKLQPNPFEDRGRHAAAVAECHAASDALLERLSERLNALHGVSRSRRYWRILVGLWLEYHVQQLCVHLTHARDAVARVPEINSQGLDPRDFLTPSDFEHSIQLAMHSDAYQLQLATHALRFLRPELPLGRHAADPLPAARGPDAGRRAARAVARVALVGPRLAGLGAVLSADLYVSRRDELRAYVAAGGGLLPFIAPPLPAFTPPRDEERRRGLAEIEGKTDLERVAVAALPAHFPILYLEGYGAAQARAASPSPRPRAFFSAVGFHSNEPFKLAAADAVEKGAELRLMQHGIYGLMEHPASERHEIGVSDRYYAWGWSALSGDSKVRDLPHPKTSRALRRAPGASDLLFIATSEPLNPLRLCRGPLGTLMLRYLDWQARFFEALPEALRAELVLRPYSDIGWGQRERQGARVPWLRQDDPARPFRDAVAGSRLTITDHPSTTFLETIGSGLPSLAFWDPGYWEAREAVEPLLQGLRDAGVLHHDPEGAARAAASARADVDGWWASPKVQAAVEAFRRRFALGDPDWPAAWSRELRS